MLILKIRNIVALNSIIQKSIQYFLFFYLFKKKGIYHQLFNKLL
jgi:hypothetical protein